MTPGEELAHEAARLDPTYSSERGIRPGELHAEARTVAAGWREPGWTSPTPDTELMQARRRVTLAHESAAFSSSWDAYHRRLKAVS